MADEQNIIKIIRLTEDLVESEESFTENTQPSQRASKLRSQQTSALNSTANSAVDLALNSRVPSTTLNEENLIENVLIDSSINNQTEAKEVDNVNSEQLLENDSENNKFNEDKEINSDDDTEEEEDYGNIDNIDKTPEPIKEIIPQSTNDENDDEIEEDDTDKMMLDDLNNTMEFFNRQAEQPEAQADANFTKVHEEYDKLHKIFMQARLSEKKLMKRCKDLSSELNANASKVQAALKLSQTDRGTITVLKKEVRKAWKMVEGGAEKESRSKEAISSMKAEIESLRRSLETSEAIGGSIPQSANKPATSFGRQRAIDVQLAQEEAIKELNGTNELISLQLESVLAENKFMRQETIDLETKLNQVISDRSTLDTEILTLKDLLATKKSELDKDSRVREKLETQLRLITDQNVKKDIEIQSKGLESKHLKDQIGKTEVTLKEEKARYEKFEKDNDLMIARLTKIQQECDEQVLTITSLLSDNQSKVRELKSWEEELTKYKDELRNVTRARDSLAKRIKVIEESKDEVEFEKDGLKGINHSILHDLDLGKKELDSSHKQIEGLKRERDIAQKNFVRATGATHKQLNVVKLTEQTKRNLEQEITAYKNEASKMRKLIYSLEKDRDRHINDSSKAEQNLNISLEEIKIKEMHIFDYKKKVTEMEKKLKEQQSMYENVRAERNLYSKNYIESQDEITEMKRKLKIMGHQIEQLKEEIANKEGALVKEHFEHSKMEKEKESLSIQIGKLQQQHEDAQKMIRNQQAEENKLRHIITETDAERLRQQKEYEAVVQERDILGTQLIRRNDELSLLYEKIKIQTSTLNKGEIQYRERLEDIRVLRLEIKKLRREKAILQTETQNVDGLRNEIFKLQREVLRERTRVKVLEEELESPMNIHRWRKLSGSDPSTYELITKIQTLQKRLISKTEEVVEKELIIVQKEKLYKEVKDVLQRQPGPEIAVELRATKEAVKIKMRECKSLASELNMYHSQVNEYKYEIERLKKELQDFKKKFYEHKKKEKDEGKRFGDSGLTYIKAHSTTGPKFVGGGFNLTNGPHQTNHFHVPPVEMQNPPLPDTKIDQENDYPTQQISAA